MVRALREVGDQVSGGSRGAAVAELFEKEGVVVGTASQNVSAAEAVDLITSCPAIEGIGSARSVKANRLPTRPSHSQSQ